MIKIHEINWRLLVPFSTKIVGPLGVGVDVVVGVGVGVGWALLNPLAIG